MNKLPDMMGSARNGSLHDPLTHIKPTGALVLKGGRVIDPKNKVDAVKDISIRDGMISKVADSIIPEKGDRVIDVNGLLVFPGLIDMHLHVGDLFEISTDPIYTAVADGVTMGLSPGAGNTLMAPSLLGAEVDRGLPMHVGVYLGAACVLAPRASVEEKIAFFRGELPWEVGAVSLSRNPITNTTGMLCVGIKDHMGHYILSDESLDAIFEISSKANLVFMSHTQDPAHAERLVGLSKGRPLHLAHATAAGCGTHADAVESMQRVVDLVKKPGVTAEFVSTQLRPGKGSREGLLLPEKAQEVAYEALANGLVKVMVSDGQNDATMKGFGDTRDNVPAILELVEMNVLNLPEAVALMTTNPAALFAERTGQAWWVDKVGHLGKGAYANVTVVDPRDKLATITIVNGVIAGFEDRAVRGASGAGGWVSKWGILSRTGVGDLAVFSYA
ncbi:MAG: amidohydrolase family protein [Firmicutes bacterium]|nr:amidohydrolase family protein [Bacillota bacterium]